jgi:hypothetical protein
MLINSKAMNPAYLVLRYFVKVPIAVRQNVEIQTIGRHQNVDITM